VFLYLKVATLAGIEDTHDARFLDWGAELTWEGLMDRENLWHRMLTYHPNIKFLFRAFMRE